VLASGSSGNACVVEANGFGVLIDFGLSPCQLEPRLKKLRLSWQRIDAVVLTHAHTDHWRPTTLSHLAKLRLPIYCHQEHLNEFNRASRAFAALDAAGLFRHYEPGDRLHLHAGMHCEPIALAHDAAKTCGFRFEGAGWSLAYAADLGSWTPSLAGRLADVDLLALEFNHDVPMQLASGRHPMLIRRILGDQGHLSNEQAAALLAEVLRQSAGRVKHVVQLHLSRHCNLPELAAGAARQVVDHLAVDVEIHTTWQGQAGPSLQVGRPFSRPRRLTAKANNVSQPLLPFAE
jgi:phosphoribosyl 1,2-cyclic phosphodiesterase